LVSGDSAMAVTQNLTASRSEDAYSASPRFCIDCLSDNKGCSLGQTTMRRWVLGKRCRNLLTKNRNAEVEPLTSTKQIQIAVTLSLSKRSIPVRDTVSFEETSAAKPCFRRS